MTNVIEALCPIRDAFGPSQGAGEIATAWLQDRLGPVGAVLVQILGALVVALCVNFCFCTLLLTFAKAMILRCVGVVMPRERTQLPLLARSATDDFEEENEVTTNMVDRYPF